MELMLMGRYRLLIIKIFGELDQHKASSVRENADRELGRTGAVNVAFNFENVTFNGLVWYRRYYGTIQDGYGTRRKGYHIRCV